MALTSGPWAPEETPPPRKLMTAARCRRLPLTSTSVWSGDRPRRFAGRIRVAASLIGCALTLYAGISVRSMSVVSPRPWREKSPPEMMSSGASVSPPVRCGRREPTTLNSSISSASAPTAVAGAAEMASVRAGSSPARPRIPMV